MSGFNDKQQHLLLEHKKSLYATDGHIRKFTVSELYEFLAYAHICDIRSPPWLVGMLYSWSSVGTPYGVLDVNFRILKLVELFYSGVKLLLFSQSLQILQINLFLFFCHSFFVAVHHTINVLGHNVFANSYNCIFSVQDLQRCSLFEESGCPFASLMMQWGSSFGQCGRLKKEWDSSWQTTFQKSLFLFFNLKSEMLK